MAHSANLAGLKIYFDCGDEDDFGFDSGAMALDKMLASRCIPHEFHIYPGRHDAACFAEHLPVSLTFTRGCFQSREGNDADGQRLRRGCKIEGARTAKMKKMGRPRKNGMVGPGHFARALMIVSVYSRARGEGSKYSAAVREAVDAVRKLAPRTPISETEVKRVVAEFLPQGSQVALKVESSILVGEEAAERRRLHAQMLEDAGIKGLTNMTESDLQKPLKRFTFGLGQKPHYPRHNAKTSKS